MSEAPSKPIRVRLPDPLLVTVLRALLSRRVLLWLAAGIALFVVTPNQIKPLAGAVLATGGGVLLARSAASDAVRRTAASGTDAPVVPPQAPFWFTAMVRFPPKIGHGRWITARLVFQPTQLRWTRFWSLRRRWTVVPLPQPVNIAAGSLSGGQPVMRNLNPGMYRAYIVEAGGSPAAEILVKVFLAGPVERALKSLDST